MNPNQASDCSLPQVLHVMDHWGTGGAQDHIKANMYAARGEFDFHVASLFNPNSSLHWFEQQGIEVHDLATDSSYSPVAVLDPRLTIRLWRLLIARPWDIVHFHLYAAPLHASVAARLPGPKDYRTILSLHAERRHLPGYIFPSFRLSKGIIDQYIVPDEDATPVDLANIGIQRSLIRVIPYGVEERHSYDQDRVAQFRSDLGISANSLVVLSAARLHEQRRLDTFLHAFAALPQSLKISNPVLILAGDGPQEASLKELAHKLGISAQVKFPGRVDDLDTLYHAADVYMTIAVRGHVGAAGYQALSANLATVALEIDGDPARSIAQTSLDQPCPTVVSERELTDLLGQLMTSSDLRSQLGQHGRQYVAKHRSSRLTGKLYAKIYRDLLSGTQ